MASGPVIFIRNNLLDAKYFNLVDALITAKQLKPSFRLFIESFNTSILTAEYATNDGVCIRYFDACDMLVGKTDPDYQTNRELKLSKVTRYNRLKTLIELGFLEPTSKPDVVELYSSTKGKPVTLYQLVMPSSIANASQSQSGDTLYQHSSEYRAQRRQEHSHATNMTFGYMAKRLDKLGSMDILASIFNDCIRATNSIDAKVIEKEKVVPHPETKVQGKISITTSTSTANDAAIMVPDDMVLLNYFYSSINEHLISNIENLTFPFQNLFRFDARSVVLDFMLDDSGGNREWLDGAVKRIVTTKLNLRGDSKALWLFEKLGIVDEEGNPYQNTDINLLVKAGEKDIDRKLVDSAFKERSAARYFDLKLPWFIENQINDVLKARTENRLPNSYHPFIKMFTRSKDLLKGEEKGLIWLIIDFFAAKLPKPGFTYGPTPIASFLTTFNASITTKESALTVMKHLFLAMHNPRRLLYCSGWFTNSRNQPRFEDLFTLVDKKFLVRFVNVTKGYTKSTRLSRLEYTIHVVRLTDDEIKQCLERSELIQQDIQYAEDKVFIDLGEAIFARAKATARQYYL